MASSPRLYLDENVALEVAARLKAGGFDVVSARDFGMLRADDPEHLEYAARDQRILLTHDTGDFSSITKQ